MKVSRGGELEMTCSDFESRWTDAEFDLRRIGPEARAHLKTCEACSLLVEEEEQLLMALNQLNGNEGVDQKPRILSLLSSCKRQRSYMAVFPVASSGFLLLAGILSWGGLPGGHIIADFPGQALHSSAELLSVIEETLAAGAQAASVASRLLPTFLEVAAGFLTFGGLVLSAGIYRRWKQRWTLHF